MRSGTYMASSLLDAHVSSRLVPLGVDLVEEGHIARVAILVARDDALEALRVVDRLDVGRVVTNKVVVEFETAWLLCLYNYVTDLKEDPFNLRVVVVESLRTINGTGALVSLQDG